MNQHASLPHLVHGILEMFNQIEKDYDYHFDRIIHRSCWRCEAGRFRVWTGNVGAHLKGTASLTYRLRQAENILQLFKDNLQDLASTLDSVVGELSKGCPKPTSILSDQRSEDHDATNDSSQDDGPMISTDPLSIAADEGMTEAEQDVQRLLKGGVMSKGAIELNELQHEREEFFEDLCEDTIHLIECLFRLTMLVRSPSRREQLLEMDIEGVASTKFDVDHVRSKFPEMDDFLALRLGCANSKRRANIHYLQRHHEKLSAGLEQDEYDNQTLSDTAATEMEPADLSSLFLKHAIEQGDDMSITSFATSFINEEGRLPIRPQTKSFDESFQCPICCHVIKATNAAAWIKHVFTDLQPYICLSKHCRSPATLFESRRSWRAHQWECQNGGDIELPQCVFCYVTMDYYKLEKHIATHLQDIALFSLPPHLTRGGDEEHDRASKPHDSDEIPSDRNDEATSGSGDHFSSQSSTDTDSSDSDEAASVLTVLSPGNQTETQSDALTTDQAGSRGLDTHIGNISSDMEDLHIANMPPSAPGADSVQTQLGKRLFGSGSAVDISTVDRHPVLDLSQKAAREDLSSSAGETGATQPRRKYESDPQRYSFIKNPSTSKIDGKREKKKRPGTSDDEA